MDYKEMIRSLRDIAMSQRTKFRRFVLANYLDFLDNAIETLLAELDAAVEDLEISKNCRTCKNFPSWCDEDPDVCRVYLWRGPKKGDGQRG